MARQGSTSDRQRATTPELSRIPSAASAFTLSPKLVRAPSTLDRSTTKRKARNLLRDYYGLGNESTAAGKDPLNADSPSFEPTKLFEQLYTTASIEQLLNKETDLRIEIQELAAEKTGLVYNHHHELIDASDKIEKMKARAESLDVSLDALKVSFENISQLATSLAAVPRARPKTERPQLLRNNEEFQEITFNPLIHLPPILNLPNRLCQLESFSERSALWGAQEPVLTAWDEAGVEGIKKVAAECREVLKRARRPSEVQKSP